MGNTFRIIFRAIQQGFLGFTRNIWLSVASILVTSLAVMVILGSFILNVAGQKAIAVLIEDLNVSVYINPEADQAQVVSLQQQLSQLDNVVAVNYVSPDEAERKFIEHFQNDPDIIKGLDVIGDYRLPASLVVVVDDLDQVETISQITSQPQWSPVIESVSSVKTDSQDVIKKAKSVKQFIVVGGSGLGAIFAVVAFLIIFNTVRIAIFSRKREIHIMSLIGSRSQFIQGIFLVEVVLIGLFSGLLATGLTYGGLFLLESFFNRLASDISSLPELAPTYELLRQTETVIKMMLAAVVGSIVLGVVSASLALKRYLKFF